MSLEYTTGTEKPSKLTPALIGGAIIGFISATPFLNFINCLCCAGTMLGGFVATYFYKDQLTPDMPPLTPSDGASVGALAGVFGFVISTALTYVVYTLFGNIGAEAMMELIILIAESIGGELPPEFYDEVRRSFEQSPLQPISLLIGAIITVIFGTIGGLIGSAVFRPKAPQIQQ